MKILFLLRSDCGNLPLSIVYNQLIAHKHEVDVVSLSDAENDLFMFDNPQKVFKWNEFFEKENLSFYDCIIASRNCFFTLQANVNKLLLDYRGVIITEHTTLYEGDNIYGDYVLTSGLYNYDRIPSNIDVPGFSIGNIKNLSNSSKAYKNIFADKDYVLFVESGHYPYGEKGRNQIAGWIIEFCNIYPNLFLVVKPRYLEENCNDVTHRNSDHIYKYIYRMCNNVLPKNLILLHKHTILAELLQYDGYGSI